MKTNIKLDLEFGICNGSMALEIYQRDLLVKKIENVTTSLVSVDIKVDFPAQLKFVLSGKNYNTDTIVDNTGLIIKDKYVILKHMMVESIPIKIDVLGRK